MVGDHPDDPAPVPASASPDGAAPGAPGGDGALELGYTVTVDNFSGPLDLLLYLVRRTELDILEVPLSLIVDQFVDTVRSWQDADLDVAGEFILMAATLLELKARTIAPPLEQPVEGAEDEPMFDPRESLLKSLLAYRRFKEAAQVIHELGESRWPLVDRQFREHVPEEPVEDSDIDLGEIDLALLATTCERILSRIGGLGPRTVVVDEMPLGVRIATLLDELSARERATITELLVGNTSRVVHITTVMATLELARQRFIEVQQPEQFGDIALRLRSAEERERTPELPPPEPEGPKRRKKLPLVTWHAPAGAVEQAPDETADDTPEEVVESDEQRFLRELEEATRVTAVLALTADVEKSFTEHWYTLHPELKPAPAPVVQPEVAPVPVVKRLPPKRRVPAEAAPAAEAPAPVAEAPAPAVVVEQPVPATETAVASPTVEVVPAVSETVAVVAAEAPVDTAAETRPPVAPAEPIAEPSPEPAQPVLPVEQWPVLHAQPVPEEAPNPLDTIASDDPAAVNAALGEQPRRAAPVADEVEEDDEDEDPDDLLADDPALVNAALQANQPHPVVERRPVSDVIIPPPTETTVWTAPVDRGQAVSAVEDDLVAGSAELVAGGDQSAITGQPQAVEPAAGSQQSAAGDQPPATTGEPTPSTEPLQLVDAAPSADDDLESDEVDPALVEASQHAASAHSVAARPLHEVTVPAATETTVWTAPVDHGQTAALVDDEAEDAAASFAAADLEPDDALTEMASPADPALLEASEHAAAPRSVEVHPFREVTIPAATETTVWTAPVDHGQTAALVDDEAEAEAVVDEARGSAMTVDATAEPVVAAEPSPAAPAEAVAAAPVVTPVSDPTPTTAPLVLADPVSAVPEPMAPMAEEPLSAPTRVVRLVDPPPPDSPPPVAPPPPLPPPTPSIPRSDSPNPAPSTAPNPKPSPMSPPPRSKLWLLIALFVAINAIWAGVLWATWLPRAVLEVATTERGGTPEQETLTWRFNLDVVDAVAQAKPPEVVPVITPAVAGRWHWSDARTLVFDAAGRLPLATTFTATLPAENFRTVHGFRLRAPGTQTWSTAALSLTDAAVETFTREGTTVALTFNQPVDPLAIAQELSVEVTPVEEPAFAMAAPAAAEKAPDVASAPQEAGGQPAVTGTQPPAVSDQQPAAGDQQPTSGDQQPVAKEPTPAVSAAASTVVASTSAPVAAPVAVAPAAQVRAITSEASSTIRLLIATPARGSATLRLPAGTVGVAGPLGLAAGWERQIALRQTLVLDSAISEVPSHGDIRVDVAVSDPQAPRELLAPVVTVEPAVAMTVSTTDAGLSLTGAFVPGETYRIRATATWPDEPATSGHVLAAYTAASEVAITIPSRPSGIWPGDGGIVDGRARFAAHAVERADVMLVTGEEECVASSELVWSGSDLSPSLDLDELTEAQPAATYRLRVRSQGEAPTTSEQTLHIDEVRVRPHALVAALSDWLLAGLAGEEQADLRVRVVRLAER